MTKNKLELVIEKENMQERLREVVGEKTNIFISSLISVTNDNPKLQECTPVTVISAGILAAALELPINKNLGFAYIIPYYNSYKKVWEAQFQMGYKGFIQLGIRTGQYKTMHTTEVSEGDIEYINRMTGEIQFAQPLSFSELEEKKKSKIIGYSAYYRLLNGFEKVFFMSLGAVKQHAKKYSKTYQKDKGMWKDDFDAMAKKTVLKLLLSKYGILSTKMEKAIINDQAVLNDNRIDYVDNNNNNKIIDPFANNYEKENNKNEINTQQLL